VPAFRVANPGLANRHWLSAKLWELDARGIGANVLKMTQEKMANLAVALESCGTNSPLGMFS